MKTIKCDLYVSKDVLELFIKLALKFHPFGRNVSHAALDEAMQLYIEKYQEVEDLQFIDQEINNPAMSFDEE